MMLVYPSKEDGDDIRDIQGHGAQCEDGVSGHGRGELQEAGEDADERCAPNGVDGCLGEARDLPEEATIRETYIGSASCVFINDMEPTVVARKRVDGARARL